MAAHRLAGPLGVEAGRGDVVAGFRMRLAGAFDAGMDPDDAGDLRQAEFAGEATVAGQPIDLLQDADGA
jgi:hypothetical protein